jgi:hypothetical protein
LVGEKEKVPKVLTEFDARTRLLTASADGQGKAVSELLEQKLADVNVVDKVRPTFFLPTEQ